ncbi:MAG: hypothetical protein J6113_06310 [Lachnospiraceae bacterium]|nr:hypothetical protein [Lachnospiraceae bacterium]
MKKCPYCKIDVGGTPEKCPLCQSRLTGEGEAPYFPDRTELQFQSFIYKLQMFIAWAVIIASLGLDFLRNIRIPGFPGLHWSLLLAMWIIAVEFLIVRLFKPGNSTARTVTWVVFIVLVLLLITSHFFGFLWLVRDWIVPVTISGALIANFVLTLVDKEGNSMSYLLSGLLFGTVPYLVMHLIHKEMPLTWSICLIISITLFAGAIIFKGRMVKEELKKRFHL